VPTSSEQPLAYRVRPGVSGVIFVRARQQERALHPDPAALAFLHRADRATRRGQDSPGRRAGKIYKAKVTESDQGNGVTSVSFGPGLPEQTSFRIELPDELKDDAGRALSNAASFPLRVGTDENPPLVKFAADFGILERVLPGNATPMLPLTVRNVESSLTGKVATTGTKGEDANATIPGRVARVAAGDEMKIIEWLQRIEIGERVQHQYDQQAQRWIVIRHGHAEPIFRPEDAQQSIAVPKPNGGKAFEVVGIPLHGPGFYVVELASPKLGAALLGEPKPFYVRAATLVTNLSVHFKLGRESSLVWVTRLSDGKPVSNAHVEVQDCGGRKYWQGASDASGIARVNLELPSRRDIAACGASRGRHEFFVVARLADDMAYAFSDWGEGSARGASMFQPRAIRDPTSRTRCSTVLSFVPATPRR
jgi:hypothetical protein